MDTTSVLINTAAAGTWDTNTWIFIVCLVLIAIGWIVFLTITARQMAAQYGDSYRNRIYFWRREFWRGPGAVQNDSPNRRAEKPDGE